MPEARLDHQPAAVGQTHPPDGMGAGEVVDPGPGRADLVEDSDFEQRGDGRRRIDDQ